MLYTEFYTKSTEPARIVHYPAPHSQKHQNTCSGNDSGEARIEDFTCGLCCRLLFQAHSMRPCLHIRLCLECIPPLAGWEELLFCLSEVICGSCSFWNWTWCGVELCRGRGLVEGWGCRWMEEEKRQACLRSPWMGGGQESGVVECIVWWVVVE